MSKLLSSIAPWIEEVAFEAITFGCKVVQDGDPNEKDGECWRRPKIVQIMAHDMWGKQPLQVPYMMVHDGKTYSMVFLRGSSVAFKMKQMTKGSLVRMNRWAVSTVELAMEAPSPASSQQQQHHQKDQSILCLVTNEESLELLGGDGDSNSDKTQYLLDSIDVRRALKSISQPSDLTNRLIQFHTRVQLHQQQQESIGQSTTASSNTATPSLLNIHSPPIDTVPIGNVTQLFASMQQQHRKSNTVVESGDVPIVTQLFASMQQQQQQQQQRQHRKSNTVVESGDVPIGNVAQLFARTSRTSLPRNSVPPMIGDVSSLFAARKQGPLSNTEDRIPIPVANATSTNIATPPVEANTTPIFPAIESQNATAIATAIPPSCHTDSRSVADMQNLFKQVLLHAKKAQGVTHTAQPNKSSQDPSLLASSTSVLTTEKTPGTNTHDTGTSAPLLDQAITKRNVSSSSISSEEKTPGTNTDDTGTSAPLLDQAITKRNVSSSSTSSEEDWQVAFKEQFDPQKVIQKALDMYDCEENKLEAAQGVYQSTLLRWTAYIDRESLLINPKGDHQCKAKLALLRDSMSTLYISMANLSKTNNDHWGVVDAYQTGTSCLISKSSGNLWLEYARFCLGVKKARAKQVFLRALVGSHANVRDGEVPDNDPHYKQLWNDFLALERGLTGNTGLTLEGLCRHLGMDSIPVQLLDSTEDNMKAPRSGPSASTTSSPSHQTQPETAGNLEQASLRKSPAIGSEEQKTSESQQAEAKEVQSSESDDDDESENGAVGISDMLLSNEKEDDEEVIDDNKSEKDATLQEVFTEEGDKTLTVQESMLSSSKEVELEAHSHTIHETLERTEAMLDSNSTPIVDAFPDKTNPSDEDIVLATLEENIALATPSSLPQNNANVLKESNPVEHEEIVEGASKPHMEGSNESRDLSEVEKPAEAEISKYKELPKFTFRFFNTKRKRAPSSCGEEEAKRTQRRTPFDVGKWLSHHVRKVTDIGTSS
eukprot:scaffold111044_cov53-Attheya_sp.AAC.2